MNNLVAQTLALLVLALAPSCGTAAPHGELTRASLIAGSAKVLRAWDKDRDGKLSRDEVTAIVDQFVRLQQAHSPNAHILNETAKERSQLIEDFAKQDSNHDGYLTLAELVRKPLVSFDCADLNHDGELSAYEMSHETDRCA